VTNTTVLNAYLLDDIKIILC